MTERKPTRLSGIEEPALAALLAFLCGVALGVTAVVLIGC